MCNSCDWSRRAAGVRETAASKRADACPAQHHRSCVLSPLFSSSGFPCNLFKTVRRGFRTYNQHPKNVSAKRIEETGQKQTHRRLPFSCPGMSEEPCFFAESLGCPGNPSPAPGKRIEGLINAFFRVNELSGCVQPAHTWQGYLPCTPTCNRRHYL